MRRRQIFIICSLLLLIAITYAGSRKNTISDNAAVAKGDIHEIWEEVVGNQKINTSNAYILDEQMEGFRILLDKDKHTVADLMLEFVSYRNPKEGNIFNVKYRGKDGNTDIHKKNTVDPSFQGHNIRKNISVNKLMDFVVNLDFEDIECLQNLKGDYYEILVLGNPKFMDYIIENEEFAYYIINEHDLEEVSILSLNNSSQKEFLPIYISIVQKKNINNNMTRYKSHRKAVILMEVDDILLTEIHPYGQTVVQRERDNPNFSLYLQRKGGVIDELYYS